MSGRGLWVGPRVNKKSSLYWGEVPSERGSCAFLETKKSWIFRSMACVSSCVCAVFGRVRLRLYFRRVLRPCRAGRGLDL